MSGPRGLAYDAAQNFLFVSDTDNNRILVYDVSTPSNGMAATYVLGQTDFVSATSGNAATALNTPKDVEYMAWPRLAALAEVVWSPRDHRDFASFRARLEPHLRRLAALDVRYPRLD